MKTLGKLYYRATSMAIHILFFRRHFRKCFSKLRQLRDSTAEKAYYFQFHNVVMDELSMGMSGDYEIAVEEGATMIRVGSALFGERIYR